MVPFAAIEHVQLVGRSALWLLVSVVVLLVTCAAIGTTLVTWGVTGSAPSWIELGLGVVAAGLLGDAVAYLALRRRAARNRVDIEIRTRVERLRLRKVEGPAAHRVLDRLRQRARQAWNS